MQSPHSKPAARCERRTKPIEQHSGSFASSKAARNPHRDEPAPPSATSIAAGPSGGIETARRTPRWRWRALAWRLQFQFWRGLEMLVQTALLRERPRRSDLRCADLQPPIGEDRDDPWRRQLSIGHGCSGPDLATPSISALDMEPDYQQANTRIAVCVVGDSDVVVQLLERLTNIGVRVHATVDTIDDYIAVKRIAAVPHRFEDMPAVAAGIDLLISTSFSRPIGATVLARLPESAVVIDLAGPPGSIDFEVAQRLGRRAIWEPPVNGHFDASWRSVADQIERLEASKIG